MIYCLVREVSENLRCHEYHSNLTGDYTLHVKCLPTMKSQTGLSATSPVTSSRSHHCRRTTSGTSRPIAYVWSAMLPDVLSIAALATLVPEAGIYSCHDPPSDPLTSLLSFVSLQYLCYVCYVEFHA